MSNNNQPIQEINRSDYCRWIIRESGLPWLILPHLVPWEQMLVEVEALDQTDWVKYRSGNSEGWWAAVIHGLEKRPWHWVKYAEEEGWKTEKDVPYGWTEVSRKCPFLTNYLQSSFGYNQHYRTRVLKVDPGGYIELHHDRDGGPDAPLERKDMSIGTWHFAIQQPEECDFIIPNWGVIPIENGTTWLFNNKWEHTIINNSDKPRYHVLCNGGDRDMNFWSPKIIEGWQQFQSNYSKKIFPKIKL